MTTVYGYGGTYANWKAKTKAKVAVKRKVTVRARVRHAKRKPKARVVSSQKTKTNKYVKRVVPTKKRVKRMPTKVVTRRGRPTGLSPGKEQKWVRDSRGRFAGSISGRSR